MLSTGTTVTADANASLAVLESGRSTVFRLETGVLHAKVAKLHGDERFVVRTLDAEIEVRGTAFRLESGAPAAACASGTRTRLVVTEGVVAVRGAGQEVLVGAGQSWPQCLEATNTATIPSHGRPPVVVPSAHAPSSLGAENDLFTNAMSSKRNGDVAGALRAFEVFVVRYPASPLRENAYVERMSLLRRMGSPAQVAAARDYLARYPNGFARTEAEKIVAGE